MIAYKLYDAEIDFIISFGAVLIKEGNNKVVGDAPIVIKIDNRPKISKIAKRPES